MDKSIKVGYEDFIVLIENDRTLEVIIEAFKAAARLDYTGERLSFDYEPIVSAVRVALPNLYDSLLATLKTDKENKTEG